MIGGQHMPDDFLISREDLLSGSLRLDRRPARIFASIEARCRYIQIESRRAIETYFLTDHESFTRRFDLDYFQGLNLRATDPRPLTISALEHYAPQWKALVPENPSLQAALIQLLAQKYPLDRAKFPGICFALGVSEQGVQRAYRQAYGERLEKVLGPAIRPGFQEDVVPGDSPEEGVLREAVDSLEWLYLPGGEVLYRQGEESAALYILISGRLRVVTDLDSGTGTEAEISRGEMVGEIEVSTGEPRGATVIAIRDSELVRLGLSALTRLMVSYPRVMMHINRLLSNRLRTKFSKQQLTGQSVIAITLVPGGPEVPLADITRAFAEALAAYAPTLHLDRTRVNSIFGAEAAEITPTSPENARLADWLSAQEASYRYIIYEADPKPTAWTVRCMRQADRVLLITLAGMNPAPGEIERRIEELDAWGRSELLLFHPPCTVRPAGTRLWLRSRPVRGHHHLRLGDVNDLHRLARWFTNQAQGLILSGGGARGLAHIGVWQALKEAGIQIDAVGGTSMGSVIAAILAMGDDPESALDSVKELFAKYRPFKEYTLPVFSIFRSKRLDQMLRAQFGEIEIEDLWVNFYCVSTNLTTVEAKIHTEGSLFKAVRSSIAIPGIVLPVIEESKLFVDGGLVNSLPGDIMKGICQGKLINVDITPSRDVEIDKSCTEFPSPWTVLLSRINPFQKPVKAPNILQIMARVSTISSIQRQNDVRREADHYLRPPVQRFGMLEFEAIDAIVQAGYRYAKEKVKELQESPRDSQS